MYVKLNGLVGSDGTSLYSIDCCAKWFDCSMNYEQEFKIIYNQLPACPCSVHPDFLPYEGKFFDDKHKRNFIWRDVTHLYSKIPRQDPAKWCIQQEPEQGSLSAQYCCYNNETALITRGSGAGTPRLISPSRFFEYHEKFDIQPWIDCKGDWTKYHAIRPPNNDLQCTQYPGEEEYQLQREQAQNY